MQQAIEGKLTASGMRFGIVISRFNDFITKELLSGATSTLVRLGANPEDISVVWVPGSFELGLTCKKVAESGSVDAVIALGAVIKGATTHFDHVAGQAAGAIARASMDTSVPVIFGVITPDTIEQAIERSGTKAGNKGSEALQLP